MGCYSRWSNFFVQGARHPTPTHRLPLCALINLRGAEHLAQSVHWKSSHTGSTSGRTRGKGSSRNAMGS
ncbi:hypothetical protein BDZ97DRAFT_85766 [Flammula alnicola]|nr:hypothetical protein BDZ97DRAFT_85766 [Flammula alnicola]